MEELTSSCRRVPARLATGCILITVDAESPALAALAERGNASTFETRTGTMKDCESLGFGSAFRAARMAAPAFACVVLGWGPASWAQGVATAAVDDRQNVDRLLVVDCLLPGQVRQLGTGVTYLAPRRAIKTTGSDCAIRGGEYVAYDRANYATALKVWLPAAQGGDKVAQTYVGEIYEKGMGTAPDYAAAAGWYRKAADQGYSRALINLGFLYEQGLGVPKDPVMALQLYRKAGGLEGSINLDAAAPTASQEELEALRKELEKTRQELEKARRGLDEERLKSSQEIERLTQTEDAGGRRRQCRGDAPAGGATQGPRGRAREAAAAGRAVRTDQRGVQGAADAPRG